MGFLWFRDRGSVDEHAKWAYLNLSDFHATSSWTPLSYLTVWFFAFIGIAVFVVDCFTAVNLLILDKWASQVKPTIPLNITKWIFVGCILFSFVYYVYEWIRAIRVLKRDGIAESYMDPLAVQVQCMKGRGWKRFLVFASLTKSKKGTDYIAFFVHFQFNNAIRIVIAEGGRQVINCLTLIKFFTALATKDTHKQESTFIQFWDNFGAMFADPNSRETAVILSSMCFTLFIWIFSALCLIIAIILYVVFLWHYIPTEDGRLSVYCRRKIDRRLEKIVEKKVQAAIARSDAKRAKEYTKDPSVSVSSLRQPTLPAIGLTSEEKGSTMIGITRSETESSFSSQFTSSTNLNAQNIDRQQSLPNMNTNYQRPVQPQRSGTGFTNFSNHSYASNAPLLQNATDMGYTNSRPATPEDLPTGMPQMPYSNRTSPTRGQPNPPPLLEQRSFTGPPPRMGSSMSMGMGTPGPGLGPGLGPGPMGYMDRNPISRMGSAMADRSESAPPLRTGPVHRPMNGPNGLLNGPMNRTDWPMTTPGPGRMAQPPFPSNYRRDLSQQSFVQPFPPRSNTPGSTAESSFRAGTSVPSISSAVKNVTANASGGSYTAFNPSIHRSTPKPSTNSPVYDSSSVYSKEQAENPVELRQLSPLSRARLQDPSQVVLDDVFSNPSSTAFMPRPPQRSFTAPLDRETDHGSNNGFGAGGRF